MGDRRPVSNGHTLHRPSFAKLAAVVFSAAMIASLMFAPQGSAEPDRPSSDGDKPTISEVKQRLDVLNHEAEIASESLNAARVEMEEAQTRFDTLQADVTHQRTRVERLRGQLVGTAVTNFQNASSTSPTTAFFTSTDASQFIESMATNSLVEEQQAGLLLKLTQQEKQLGVQEQQAQEALDVVTEDKVVAAKHQSTLDARTADAKKLLSSLEAAERARLLRIQAAAPHPEVEGQEEPSRSAPRAPVTNVAASGRAAIAVRTALAQVGDPYVYGAAGPSSFDCSGLTMYAWRAAGVSIPHASSMQPGAGTPVSISSLQPGDLVFYYSPISHVGMYIGGGRLVHAPHPGASVEVVSVNSMPIAMAVRIA